MAKHKTSILERTLIKFRFVKAGGFTISGYGNFWPDMTMKPKQIPGISGQFWEIDYDFNKVFEVKLKPENPRELPDHIAAKTDEVTRSAYLVEAAKIAATSHEENNRARDELNRLVEVGLIELLGDSFYDQEETTDETVVAALAAAKTVTAAAHAVVASKVEAASTEEPTPAAKKRGRPKGSMNKPKT